MAMPRVRSPIRFETGVWFAIERQLTEDPSPLPRNWSRPVVRAVTPQVDGGRRPAKTTVGELVTVEADAFIDGHDAIRCDLRARHSTDSKWVSYPMRLLFDDRWRGAIPITETGRYRFSVRARVDEFLTWRNDLRERSRAGQDLSVELEVGAEIVERAAPRARAHERHLLASLVDAFRSSPRGLESAVPPTLAEWASRVGERDAGECRVLGIARFRDGGSHRSPFRDQLRVLFPRRRSRQSTVQLLVRAVSPLGLGRSGPSRHVRRCATGGSTTSSRWVSMSCTCRRFTRSG